MSQYSHYMPKNIYIKTLYSVFTLKSRTFMACSILQKYENFKSHILHIHVQIYIKNGP